MIPLRIYDLLHKQVLVSRETARTIEPQLVAAIVDGTGELVLDLSDVDGLAPSFFDETLSIIGEALPAASNSRFRLTIINPPTRLSSKFKAVGRVHGLTAEERDGVGWIIERTEQD